MSDDLRDIVESGYDQIAERYADAIRAAPRRTSGAS
jgi:hypothetical protein